MELHRYTNTYTCITYMAILQLNCILIIHEDMNTCNHHTFTTIVTYILDRIHVNHVEVITNVGQ